jgi:transcriptional regulator with XRE-family HTH domain
MLRRLGFEEVLDYKRISEYELGKNEPPLAVLLSYARAVNVSTDVLIDDRLDLPAKLPAKPKHS